MSTLFMHYVTQYGYAGLFVILGTSILGLPLPDETFLTFIGFLTFTGKLNPLLSIAAAAAGSMSGITLSYLLGRFFQRFILHRLEKHAGKQRLAKVFDWYHRHGGKLLTIGYFLPGIRHLSGYISGLSRLRYRSFAIFAYLGAVLWTTLWILLGRLLGSRWETLLPIVHRYALVLGISALLLFLAFYLIYRNHARLGDWVVREFQRLPERYLALGKRRWLVTIGGLTFVALFILLMGLIQDLVANEVGEFDQLVAAWLSLTSPPVVIHAMQTINALGTHLVILIVFLIAIVAFYLTSNRWTPILPLALAWGGGSLIDHLFRLIFQGEGVGLLENLTPFQAPSPSFQLAGLSFYAVLAYLMGREKSWGKQLAILLSTLLLLGLLGISPIYLRLYAPSAVVTGMTVSGLWALVCVFGYEFRLYKLETTS